MRFNEDGDYCTSPDDALVLALKICLWRNSTPRLWSYECILESQTSLYQISHCEARGWKSCSEGKLRAAGRSHLQLKNHLLFFQTSTCCGEGRKLGEKALLRRHNCKKWNHKTGYWKHSCGQLRSLHTIDSPVQEVVIAPSLSIMALLWAAESLRDSRENQ